MDTSLLSDDPMLKDRTIATVLVVDDTPDNLALMATLLRDHYLVKVANHGEKALRIAQSDAPPDLILLDIMMPGLTATRSAGSSRRIPPRATFPSSS